MAEKTNLAGVTGKDSIESAVTLIYEGDQQQAAGILDAEINRRVAEARAASVTDFSWDQELKAFNRDHADIARDPGLAAVFQRHLNEAAKTLPTPHDAIEKATETVNGWLAKVRATRARPRVAQDEEYDPSSVVAEMRRARGQT